MPPFSLQELGSAGARPHAPGHGRGEQRHQARAAGVRPGQARNHPLTARWLSCRPASWACWRVLLQRAGRLVSKEQLVERLCEWGEEVSNNAIEVYIHRLRKKIEGPDPHCHGARAGLLPGKDPRWAP